MDEKTRHQREQYYEAAERRLNELTNQQAKTFDEQISVRDIDWLAMFHIKVNGDNRG